jgi:hypothetical protein
MCRRPITLALYLALCSVPFSALAWNPFAKKSCVRETPLENSDFRQVDFKLHFRGGNVTGSVYHQLGGYITCKKIHMISKDGKTHIYNINWVINSNMVEDIQSVRLQNGVEYSKYRVECSCDRIDGIGSCVGYTGLLNCK